MTGHGIGADTGVDGLGHSRPRSELEHLRLRSTEAREATMALAAAARHLRTVSQAACGVAQENRAQWSAWRTALARLADHAGGTTSQRLLLMCPCCDAVCAPVTGAERAAELWIDPPAVVKQKVREGWRGLVVSETMCPRCTPKIRPPEVDAPLGGEPRILPADVARMLSTLLMHVGTAADVIVARTPGMDVTTALDLAFDTMFEQMDTAIPADELASVADALRALLHELRGDGGSRSASRAAGAPARHARSGGASGHFRPALRSV